MIQIQENIDIKELTTFKVPAFCRYFAEVSDLNELEEALKFAEIKKIPVLFLGGGSNLLFVNPYKGLVIKVNIKGISEEIKDNDSVLVTAKAGEQWNNFVQYCIKKDYGGLENLSLIPGNAGTAPIQNIGAYGVEMKDCFHSLKALNIETKELEIFDKTKCNFGYRDSFFKNKGKK